MSAVPGPVVSALGDHRSDLGEGPIWLDQLSTLQFVDIASGWLHRMTRSGRVRTHELGGQLSAALPALGGGLVVARDLTLMLLDSDLSVVASWPVDGDPADVRLNDCRVDPRGRLWAGTMSTSRTPARGGLYRLGPGGPVPVITPTTLSNGLGWSSRGDVMYFIDSTTQRIDRYTFDASRGSLSNRETFATVPAEDGLPDGLVVDAEGHVWVCLFGGGSLRRYAPSGVVDREIRLPVTYPTCPAFGPAGSGELFVTSSRHLLSARERAREPLAGAVLVTRVGGAGVPTSPFDPSTAGLG